MTPIPTTVEFEEAVLVPIPPPPGAPPTSSVIGGVGMGDGGNVASSGPRVHMNDGGVTLCTGSTKYVEVSVPDTVIG